MENWIINVKNEIVDEALSSIVEDPNSPYKGYDNITLLKETLIRKTNKLFDKYINADNFELGDYAEEVKDETIKELKL